jgi:hypothetical protein
MVPRSKSSVPIAPSFFYCETFPSRQYLVLTRFIAELDLLLHRRDVVIRHPTVMQMNLGSLHVACTYRQMSSFNLLFQLLDSHMRLQANAQSRQNASVLTLSCGGRHVWIPNAHFNGLLMFAGGKQQQMVPLRICEPYLFGSQRSRWEKFRCLPPSCHLPACVPDHACCLGLHRPRTARPTLFISGASPASC